MIIQLNNLLPFPIKELDYRNSNIWGVENVIFDSSNFYLVKATSGKGKTTLLSSIYGIRKDYDGEILIDSVNIKKYSLNKFATLRKKKLSYIFQGLDLFDDLTVYENIEIKNKLTKFKTKTEILEFLNILNILDLEKRKIKTLSFGQKQRVAIVRALCQPFEFLLLDEPFSHLDNDNIKKSFDLIEKECRKQNAGLILTSLSTNYEIDFTKTFNI